MGIQRGYFGKSQLFVSSNAMYHPFTGNRKVSSRNYHSIPSFLSLFQLFWILEILRDIVDETNHYTIAPINEHGNTKGGPYWENLSIFGLKAFMALALYMDHKMQLN